MSVTLIFGATTVTLPSPEWGDSYAVDTKVTTHRTMNGEMRSYRRTGNIKRLTYTFKLDLDTACAVTGLREALNALLLDAVGQDITLVNHDDETWIVKCITPDPTYTNIGNWWNVTLSFEGELDA